FDKGVTANVDCGQRRKKFNGSARAHLKQSVVILFRAWVVRNRCGCRRSLKAGIAFWFATRIDVAARVISASVCRMWRNAVELLSVSALRPGDSIELGQAGVVPE